MVIQPSKLLDRVRRRIRLKGYSIRTERAYVSWIKRYILFHDKRHPQDMGKDEIENFLSHLAIKQKVSKSTQNQAFNALLFLYREILEKDPDTPGSLGIAISEAVEAAVTDTSGETRYSLGSVLNHVMLHQTIIGLEAKIQMEKIGEYPDIVIGCAGGGSNFAGLAFPYAYDKINGKDVGIYPVEPEACPTMTQAPFAYDHGDFAKMTPLLPMHSLGHAFVPPPLHAGGLRYHGMAPTVSQMVSEGIMEAKAVGQLATYT